MRLTKKQKAMTAMTNADLDSPALDKALGLEPAKKVRSLLAVDPTAKGFDAALGLEPAPEPEKEMSDEWKAEWKRKQLAAQALTHWPTKNGILPRIPYGSESDFDGLAPQVYPTCGDCGVELGQLHVPICDVEQCPSCGRQCLGCECKTGDARAVCEGRYARLLADLLGHPHRLSRKEWDASNPPKTSAAVVEKFGTWKNFKDSCGMTGRDGR